MLSSCTQTTLLDGLNENSVISCLISATGNGAISSSLTILIPCETFIFSKFASRSNAIFPEQRISVSGSELSPKSFLNVLLNYVDLLNSLMSEIALGCFNPILGAAMTSGFLKLRSICLLRMWK